MTDTSFDQRVDLLGRNQNELAALLAAEIDRPFRVQQVFRHLYAQGADSWSELTNLPQGLREELRQRFRIGRLPVRERHRAEDGTVKILYELIDGATIETVDIPEAKRRTLCLSSQAGCALACRFCVTGYWGAGRDLTAGEIVAQVLGACGRLPYGEPVNLVFMGMGEPLLNLDVLRNSIEVLADAISWRRITVSTVGILPALQEMACWLKRPNLAISLHAPDDDRRSALMPVNLTYPLGDLLAVLKDYPLERGRKITFEYLLIEGFNDARQDAVALVRLLQGVPAKVNLIPINPDPVLGADMKPPVDGVVAAFAKELRARNLVTTVRRRRGDDVSAACGQLRAAHRDPRGFRRSNLSY